MVVSRSQPKFVAGEDAIAFYKNERGIFPCIVIRPIWQRHEWTYKVTTSNGNQVTKRESELQTGWEPDFPVWSEVRWGNFNPQRYAAPPGMDEDAPAFDEREPDADYYSELAERYE